MTHLQPPLTDTQRKILDFIVECQREQWAPTFREIGRKFNINSLNGVMSHINALERKRFIARPHLLARRIRVLDTGRVETLWGSFEIEDIQE